MSESDVELVLSNAGVALLYAASNSSKITISSFGLISSSKAQGGVADPAATTVEVLKTFTSVTVKVIDANNAIVRCDVPVGTAYSVGGASLYVGTTLFGRFYWSSRWAKASTESRFFELWLNYSGLSSKIQFVSASLPFVDTIEDLPPVSLVNRPQAVVVLGRSQGMSALGKTFSVAAIQNGGWQLTERVLVAPLRRSTASASDTAFVSKEAEESAANYRRMYGDPFSQTDQANALNGVAGYLFADGKGGLRAVSPEKALATASRAGFAPPGIASLETETERLDSISNDLGSMLYRASTSWQSLDIGDNGDVLSSDGVVPTWLSFSAKIDASFGSTRGSLLVRSTSAWSALSIGDENDLLVAGADDPAWSSLSTLLDAVFSSSRGAVLTRGASEWSALAPGSSGYRLTANGTGADVSWNAPITNREQLSADRTYYVRTDGSDSNTGLTNTSGGAFLTIQKAVDTVAVLDISTYTVTIQIAAGTYASVAGIQLKTLIGSGRVIIVGDETTPANVVVSRSGAGTVSDANIYSKAIRGVYSIRGVLLSTTSSGTAIALLASGSSILEFQNVTFSTGFTQHIRAADNGAIEATGAYTVSGGASTHMIATANGTLRIQSITVTVSGTPAFSSAFATAVLLGSINCSGITFSGSATGTRYSATLNGVVNTNGGGASYFPGDAAGSTATGGQYA